MHLKNIWFGKPLLADHLVTFVEYNFIILLAFGGKKSL
jgi:hypothetical protein